MASETYEFFKNLSNGEEINRWSYPDGLIYDVRHTRGSNSIKVVITFDDDDDFLEILGITREDEDRYTWHRYMRDYYNDHYLDLYRYQEDWGEGYTLQTFNDENEKIVNEILKFTNPTLILGVNEYSKIARFLKTRFPDHIEELIYDHAIQHEECVFKGAKKEIMKETDNPFKRFGIIQKSHGYKFETTVSIILKLYRLLNAEDEDLKGLLKKLRERYSENGRIGDWDNLTYEAWCDDFDQDLLQKSYKKHLNEMLEEVLDELDGTDFERYTELYNTVIKLGGFDKWIKIPEKNISVLFKSLDEKTNKLVILIANSNAGTQARTVDNLEDLNLTLYHPELFESIKKTLRKFL
jgi:hypothetical protein